MRPAILLASSRPDGNTRALAELAFPQNSADFEDIASIGIGYYSYTHANEADAFYPLVQRLLAHDTWVLATPLYWYSMSAQAKTFIDRLSDLLSLHKDDGRRLRGKSLAVICAGTDPRLPPGFSEPFQLTCTYLGMNFLGVHYGQFENRTLVHESDGRSAAEFGLSVLARPSL